MAIERKTYIRKVEICTDGACRGNPGPGGWGAVLSCNGKTREISGGEPNTTTNIRMEMTAIIQALNSLKYPSKVHLLTDCEFAVKGWNDWLPGWKARGWKTAKGLVQNRDLWEELEAATVRHAVTFQYVRGHAGHTGNERADYLAKSAVPL